MPTSARICNVFRVDVGIDPYDNASINRNLPVGNITIFCYDIRERR